MEDVITSLKYVIGCSNILNFPNMDWLGKFRAVISLVTNLKAEILRSLAHIKHQLLVKPVDVTLSSSCITILTYGLICRIFHHFDVKTNICLE